MKILYEDNHLLVVEKPVNVPTQADSSGDADLLSMCKDYIKKKYEKPGDVFLGLVQRLDRPVGGVMVFARTSKAASRLAPQFGGRGADKRYAAIVCGEPPARQRLEDRILRDERTGFSAVASGEESDAKAASLDFFRCGVKNETSLLDVSLHTGRHHQIRVQLANAGFPISGDQRYNKDAVPGKQIALWAYSLTVEHPTKKERMTFTSLPSGGAWTDFSEELRCLAAGVKPFFIDRDIVCAYKPAGMSVVAEDGGDALETRLLSAFGEIYPVHRLDVATGGLVLLARNPAAREALDEAIRMRTIRKFYRCTVYGAPERESAELRAYLIKDEKASRVTVTDSPLPGAKEIITRYRTLERRGDTTRLEIELVTGRTHQIRAHMAHIGLPLVGDDRYGDRELDRKAGARSLSLEAVRLELGFPEGSALMRLQGKIFSLED